MILEPAFLLIYYGGFLYSETYDLPVSYKRWFIDRLSKELSKGNDDEPRTSRAAHQNSPDIRALQGMNRPQTPSRLRRFT